jgi:hypothetical protein
MKICGTVHVRCVHIFIIKSSLDTETTNNQTAAYRMCSGSQQGRTGVDGDGGGGSIDLT